MESLDLITRGSHVYWAGWFDLWSPNEAQDLAQLAACINLFGGVTDVRVSKLSSAATSIYIKINCTTTENWTVSAFTNLINQAIANCTPGWFNFLQAKATVQGVGVDWAAPADEQAAVWVNDNETNVARTGDVNDRGTVHGPIDGLLDWDGIAAQFGVDATTVKIGAAGVVLLLVVLVSKAAR